MTVENIHQSQGLFNETLLARLREITPVELRQVSNWVVWKLERRSGAPPDDKPTKMPYNPKTHGKADASDPATWATFDDALLALQTGRYTGVGFEFAFPVAGIDLDECRNAETGIIEDWAWEVIKAFDSYTEISPSGTGIHIFIKAGLPGGGINRRNVNGHKIEMYDTGRFFTFTAIHLEGTPRTIAARQKEAVRFYNWVLEEAEKSKAKKSPAQKATGATITPQREVADGKPPAISDEKVVDLGMNSKNGAKFESLFSDGNTAGYPSHSEADAALVSRLCFWSSDDAQVERLWRASALSRPKLDERPDYVTRTISSARAAQTAHYSKEYGGRVNGKKRQEVARSEPFDQVFARSTAYWNISDSGYRDWQTVIAIANGRKVFKLSGDFFARHVRTNGLENEEQQKIDDRTFGWRRLKALREELAQKISYPVFIRRTRGVYQKEASTYELDLTPFYEMLEIANADSRTDEAPENRKNYKPLQAREDAAVVIAKKYHLQAEHPQEVHCVHCSATIRPKTQICNSCGKPQADDESSFHFKKWQSYRDAILKKAGKGASELADSCTDVAGINLTEAIIDNCNQLVTEIAKDFLKKIPSKTSRNFFIEKQVIKRQKDFSVTSQKPVFPRIENYAEPVKTPEMPRQIDSLFQCVYPHGNEIHPATLKTNNLQARTSPEMADSVYDSLFLEAQ